MICIGLDSELLDRMYRGLLNMFFLNMHCSHSRALCHGTSGYEHVKLLTEI